MLVGALAIFVGAVIGILWVYSKLDDLYFEQVQVKNPQIHYRVLTVREAAGNIFPWVLLVVFGSVALTAVFWAALLLGCHFWHHA